MSIKNIVESLLHGDMVTAESELVNELNIRRDEIVEEGRQFIMASIEDSVNGPKSAE